MSSVRVSCAALLLVATSACGGQGPASPAAPSSVTAPAGATIIGTVQSGGSPMLAATTGSTSAAGLTVTVVGTNISTTVSGTGQFTLTGVPGGSTQLRFSGPGVDATIAISVQGSETITITVAVNGSKAELKDEGHVDHGDAELHGNVVELSGTAASFTFRIGGQMVRGDAATQFFGDGNRNDTFAQLDNGDRVEVKGITSGGSVYAQRIHINGGDADDDADDDHGADDDDDDDDDHGDDDGEHRDGETEIRGSLAGLGGACPSITFSLGGNAVATNGSTEFSKVACSALRNGDTVKVEGRRQPSGVVLASEVKRQ